MKMKKRVICVCLSLVVLLATACGNTSQTADDSQPSNASSGENIYYEGVWVEVYDQDGVVIKYPKQAEAFSYEEYESGVVFNEEYGMNMNPYMMPTYEQEKSLVLKLGEVAEADRQTSLENLLQNGQTSKYEEKQNTNCELTSYVYADLDENGTMELFATVYNGVDAYILYYVNEDTVVELERVGFTFGLPKIVSMNESQFVQLDFYGTTSHISFLYSVVNGLPYETSVSKNMIADVNVYDELILLHSTYDASFIVNEATYGHTWKPYYFYFASNGDFREYGGIEITLNDVYKIEGATEILEEFLTDEYEVTIVYYRRNGIININRLDPLYDESGSVLHAGENSYVTLRITENGIVVEEVAPGIYKAALIPEIADYPKKNELPF